MVWKWAGADEKGMDQFVTEVLEPKLWLTQARCNSLKDSQSQLIEQIDAMEARLQLIKSSTEPVHDYEAACERLRVIRKRLLNINEKIEKSHRRLSHLVENQIL